MTAPLAPLEEQLRLLMRGVEYGDPHLHATMERELRERLATGRPLRVYGGFDPTAVDLHLGHLIPMLKMRQFQKLGHEVTFLIGTMTGIVGDPSDRTAARQMLTSEAVEANARTWLRQAYRVLDPEKTVVKRNGDWLAPLTLAEVVQIASHFTVSQFLDHETFRNRLAEGKPLYLHEFIYALMQAYDACIMKTDVQVGGVEQLFNIMAGRDLQRARGERPLVAVCLPILIGTDGNLRMSKSTGNYVGLDDSPADMYGKVMSIPDSVMPNWFTLLTDVPADEVAAIERGIGDRPSTLREPQGAAGSGHGAPNPMEAKKRLAREVVALLHGAEAASAAQAEFERVFQRREDPEELAVEARWEDLPFDERNKPAGLNLPWKDLPFAELIVVGMPVAQFLATRGAPVLLATLVSRITGVSLSEARRLIQQGAVTLDGRKAAGAIVNVKPGAILRIGKHHFVRIVGADRAGA